MKTYRLLSPVLGLLVAACADTVGAQAPPAPPGQATVGAPAPPAPPGQAPAATPNGAGEGVEEYRIGPEDVLQISVWKNDVLSRTVSVRPDGMISLPLLNDVQAAGMTPAELRAALVKRLAEYMPDPDVSVIVQDVRFFKVSVIGEVTRPGRFELKSRATVLDVLAQAGGFKDFASRSRIVVLRADGGAMKRIPFNYNKAISDGQTEILYLRPGDIVVVP
jgi:polysaccharide export outer membrane protein